MHLRMFFWIDTRRRDDDDDDDGGAELIRGKKLMNNKGHKKNKLNLMNRRAWRKIRQDQCPLQQQQALTTNLSR